MHPIGRTRSNIVDQVTQKKIRTDNISPASPAIFDFAKSKKPCAASMQFQTAYMMVSNIQPIRMLLYSLQMP